MANDVYLRPATDEINSVRLRTDAADSGGSIDISSATTDGSDVLAAQGGPVIGCSSATTDGADVMASQLDMGVVLSCAVVDGADVLATNVAPLVSTTSSSTDGADTLAGSVSPLIATSSATTDGQDALAGAVSPIVAAASEVTDSADLLVANASPLIESVAALVDGLDLFAANVELGAVPRNDSHDGAGGASAASGQSAIWKIPSKHKQDWKAYKKFDEDRRQHLIEAFNELVEPAKEIGIPPAKIAQAKKIIYRDVPELNVGRIQKDLVKVKEMMKTWQEQINRAEEEGDEAALLLLL